MQTQTIHYIPAAKKMDALLRIAAYCRVSSDSEDQLESYAAQMDYFGRKIAENPLWELVDLYADEGLTGTRADKREDFQRLMRDCRAGKIDKIITKSISRFARNTSDCLACVRELKALGVEVYFEKENLDTSAVSSELLLSFYGSAAQEESLSISNNMRWSYQQRMKRGEFITCKAPYGYKMDGSNIRISPDSAAVVQYIFSHYLSGVGATSIAQTLNEMGVPTPQKAIKWSAYTVCYILSNEKYIGDSLIQKKYTTDTFPFEKKRNNGERSKFYIENTHEPIVSRDVAENARILLKTRCNNAGVEHKKYTFSLMVYCSECGTTFRRRVTRNKVYWVCRRHDERRENCAVGRVPEIELEQAFIRLHHKLRSYEREILGTMSEQLATLKERATYGQSRIAEIDEAIATTGRQTMILSRLFGEGHMDAAYFHAQNLKLNQTVNNLRRERRKLTETADDESITQTEMLTTILRSSSERFNTFDAELFKNMVKCITVDSEKKIRFELINGLGVTE